MTEFVAPFSDPLPEVGIPAVADVSGVAPAVDEAPPAWPSPEFTTPPPLPSFSQPESQPSQPSAPPFFPPAAPPSQAEIRSSILEPPSTSFATPDWQNTASNFASPKLQDPSVSKPADPTELDSPFQMTAADETPPDMFTPAGWSQPPPVEHPRPGAYQEFASSTLGTAPTPAFPTNPQSIFTPPTQPTEVPTPPAAADTDRVENLLRQFRDRYGRGSL